MAPLDDHGQGAATWIVARVRGMEAGLGGGYGCRCGVEPGESVRVVREQGCEGLHDARVIGVEPGALIRRQHGGIDEGAVDGRERQRLEAEEAPVGVVGFLHHHQVLDPDAVGAGLVVAGLVGDNHAGRERCA